MFRSILVPLDGFAFGEHALPMALSIARRAKASVKLLHVLQPFVEVVPELAAYQGPMEAEYRQDKQKYLDGLTCRLKEVCDVPISADMVDGAIASNIRHAAEAADLVVMTTHGRGPFARFWLGSVADQLIRELHAPMLMMHPGNEAADFTKEPNFRRMLLPLDGTDLSEQIVPPARELARLMNAEFRLLRVVRTEVPPDFGYQYRGGFASTQAREMVAQMEAIQKRQVEDAERYLAGVGERIRSIGLRAEARVMLDEAPAQAILHEAGKVDVVALATHGYGGLKRLWLGSVADKVIRGSTVPVLVQRPKM